MWGERELEEGGSNDKACYIFLLFILTLEQCNVLQNSKAKKEIKYTKSYYPPQENLKLKQMLVGWKQILIIIL